MLNNASGLRKVYIATGYTDLRRGIDGLASMKRISSFCFVEGAVTASRGCTNSDIGINEVIPIFQLFRQNWAIHYRIGA